MSSLPREIPSIDPVRDLLGKLESQISNAESGRYSGASDSIHETIGAFQSRLASELHEIRDLREDLRAAEKRGNEKLLSFTQAMGELRSQLPSVIDESVSSRLIEIEERFHQDIKEIHSRSLDAFVQSAQGRVGQRIAALENSMSGQMEAMAQLQDYQLRTDRNVQRLLGGLDRLSAELMRLSSLAGAPVAVPRRQVKPAPLASDPFQPRSVSQDHADSVRREPPAPYPEIDDDSAEMGGQQNDRVAHPLRLLIPLLVILAMIPLGIIGWKLLSGSGGLRGVKAARQSQAATAPAPLSGTALKLKNASEFASAKDYAAAESVYRTVLKSEPGNREAIKELASVLFKQQRYEEAAAILKSLPTGEN